MTDLPPVIFGTSGLGNLYKAQSQETKNTIIKNIFTYSPKPVVFDSAGKYGAGLALESLGNGLRSLGIKPDEVIISNKLGWVRTPLTTPEPTFEPGVWVGLQHDAVQKISYEGIIECYEQGVELLGGYETQLVSVHDPDEYLAAATNENDKKKRYQDILDAYRALFELKAQGKVKAVGIGAKDWHSIQTISRDIDLDWVMIANSMTLHSHPADLLAFMQELEDKNVTIINSAVFNGGFLLGGEFYNYKPVDAADPKGRALLEWRERFYEACREHNIEPIAACVRFALSAPGTESIALSTTNPDKIKVNLEYPEKTIHAGFWEDLKAKKLIDPNYAYL
ncbi:aldo/keto reductase [Mucilaginibacter sp. RS28]|uniref:Aldo/keto reductase n=1 Tax=Mucilaginibacter straminoryzae TaxID=2932774 RepID=A0A9X1X0Q4_9SPHI|nr:aldo/keto reductase [Mucilaginibacter straminoryzae]MCJ8208646.1 aldo/keto reductase [Mucilaginibacter straminoryzae]